MKKFFQKVKLDAKFKSAGEGHRLNDESGQTSATSQASSSAAPVRQQPMSESQANAAIAAMERLEKSKPSTSKKRIKLPEDLANTSRANQEPKTLQDLPQTEMQEYSIEGIKFVSALTGDIVSERHLEVHYKENLIFKLGSEEAISASCTMIHTLNKDRRRVDAAVGTLVKYIDNIVANQGEEKYRKIRKGNKLFSEKVSTLDGAEEFLYAAGFKLTLLASENKEELYFVLPSDANIEKLKLAKDCLLTTLPLKSKLYRDTKVFKSSDYAMRFNLPNSFFNLTLNEVRQEQGRLSEEVELNQQLRTKAMRERPKTCRRYKYTLIRVRFPDGTILQGTFVVNEKFSSVREFVGGSLTVDWVPCVFKTSLGKVIDQDDETLQALSLVPSVVLNLSWLSDVHAQLNEEGIVVSLKPELLKMMEVLT